ncbi:hypothetical protein [Streptomyces sp. NPDC021212]|uniref:hypothetical protein n=1 Tax=Streptomyces sp. NPDC021212 TaxID=3365118 RepID=UPI0037B5EB0F
MASAGRLWAVWCAATAVAVLLPRGPLLIAYLAVVVLLWATAEMMHGPASNALSAEAAPEGARGTYLAAFQYSFATADMVTPGLFGVLYGVDRVLPWVAVGCLALTASVAIRPLERRLSDRSAARIAAEEMCAKRPGIRISIVVSDSGSESFAGGAARHCASAPGSPGPAPSR